MRRFMDHGASPMSSTRRVAVLIRPDNNRHLRRPPSGIWLLCTLVESSSHTRSNCSARQPWARQMAQLIRNSEPFLPIQNVKNQPRLGVLILTSVTMESRRLGVAWGASARIPGNQKPENGQTMAKVVSKVNNSPGGKRAPHPLRSS